MQEDKHFAEQEQDYLELGGGHKEEDEFLHKPGQHNLDKPSDHKVPKPTHNLRYRYEQTVPEAAQHPSTHVHPPQD